MRARGEVHEDVHLACVANPSLEGSAHGPARLRAKLEAGAEMVVTQPALIQTNHRAWWGEFNFISTSFLAWAIIMTSCFVYRRGESGATASGARGHLRRDSL